MISNLWAASLTGKALREKNDPGSIPGQKAEVAIGTAGRGISGHLLPESIANRVYAGLVDRALVQPGFGEAFDTGLSNWLPVVRHRDPRSLLSVSIFFGQVNKVNSFKVNTWWRVATY